MLYQIVSLLLEIATGLLTGLCLLRLYMQHQRIPMSARSGNPMGPFLFAATDWLVLPLRRVIPALGRWDLASLTAAWLAQLVLFGSEWLWMGSGVSWTTVIVLALFGVLRMAISALTGMVIVYAVLSWVQTHSQLSDLMERLVAPPLTPIRRVIPLVGGVDLSPLALLVLLQIATIVVGTLQSSVLAMLN
jgi:YggT family protein